MVETTLERTSDFEIVGAGFRHHEPKEQTPTLRQRLKGKPILAAVILLVIVLGCIFAPYIANHDPAKYYYDATSLAPNGEYYFGTDSLGRDLFSIMFYGGRSSLTIGVLGAAVVALLGITYGTLSGTASDRVDGLLMRIMELFGAIPGILLIGWFGLARIVRGEVRQIRNTEYVLYARSIGGKFFYVMRRHLVPNFLSAIMFVVVSSVSSCITTESTLSFLGLGLPLDVLSWGSMLSLANRALILNTWWVIIIPGLFLVITLLCITDLGNYLRKETNRKSSNL